VIIFAVDLNIAGYRRRFPLSARREALVLGIEVAEDKTFNAQIAVYAMARLRSAPLKETAAGPK
jgi:hypothetical protein